jgi:hypothetical protein
MVWLLIAVTNEYANHTQPNQLAFEVQHISDWLKHFIVVLR